MININEELKNEISKCVKCGACLSVCPVYKEIRDESNSPRGRAALAEEAGLGNLEISAKLIEIFTKCLGCGGCEDVCQKDVPLTKIIYEMRETLYKQKYYDKAFHAVIRMIYRAPYAFSLLLKNAALLKPVLFEEAAKGDQIRPRISLPFLDRSRTLPEMRRKFFLDDEFPDKSDKKGCVSLYTGCIFNYIYPEISRDSLNILEELGVDVHVESKQVCCGYPAMSVGDFYNLKKSVLKNIELLEKTRPKEIVVLCSSCSLMFKKYYPMIFEGEDKSVRRMVGMFSEKVTDFAVFLNRHKEKLDKLYDRKKNVRVTYHQPCHLRLGRNAGNVIRDIVSGRKKVELVDPEYPETCCGYGGVFNYKHSDLALKISDRKIYDLISTKADTVLTTCSGCIMQLREGLARHGSDVKVKHISEFISHKN